MQIHIRIRMRIRNTACDSNIFTSETKRKLLRGGREEGEGCGQRMNPLEVQRVRIFRRECYCVCATMTIGSVHKAAAP
jgi:hypothetical protein